MITVTAHAASSFVAEMTPTQIRAEIAVQNVVAVEPAPTPVLLLPLLATPTMQTVCAVSCS